MKKTLLSVLAVLALVGLMASPAMAQDDAGKEKFYDFDDMLIDGEFKTPQGLYENARDEAKFERLLKLKQSFLSKIEETAQEDALD